MGLDITLKNKTGANLETRHATRLKHFLEPIIGKKGKVKASYLLNNLEEITNEYEEDSIGYTHIAVVKSFLEDCGSTKVQVKISY